jgi:hypothetical protein
MINEDLLSVVERPAIQDLLEITDEQFSQVEDLRREAEADAMTVLLNASELAKQSTESAAGPSHQSDARGHLNERTMRVLNAQQTAAYRELGSPVSQRKRLSREARLSLMRQHGETLDIRTEVKDGQVTTTVVLHDAFEHPELVKELKLSDAQQKEISKILDELRPEIVAEIESSRKAYHDRESKKRAAFDELLNAHNRQFHTKAVGLLTTAQSSTLGKERFRGLGLPALQKPEIKAALNLTEEQSKAIADIQTRPAPQVEIPTVQEMTPPVSQEEFHKRALESGQKIREFMDRQSKDIGAVLSDEQRITFTGMTGHQFPRDRGIRMPGTSL